MNKKLRRQIGAREEWMIELKELKSRLTKLEKDKEEKEENNNK